MRSGQARVMVRPGSRSKHFVDAVKVETNTMIYVLLDTEILIKQQRVHLLLLILKWLLLMAHLVFASVNKFLSSVAMNTLLASRLVLNSSLS